MAENLESYRYALYLKMYHFFFLIFMKAHKWLFISHHETFADREASLSRRIVVDKTQYRIVITNAHACTCVISTILRMIRNKAQDFVIAPCLKRSYHQQIETTQRTIKFPHFLSAINFIINIDNNERCVQ